MGSRGKEAADEIDEIFREILPDLAKYRSVRHTTTQGAAHG